MIEEPTTHLPQEQPVALCPSCDHWSKFTYLGEQRWPAEVAALTGFPLYHSLWLCENCCSSIANPQFKTT